MSTILFDDIRPYCDQEAPAVIERLLSSAEYRYVFGKMMPDVKPQEFEQMMLRCKSTGEFKHIFGYTAVKAVSEKTTFSLSLSGRSRIPDNGAYIFISNHRDIVLDSAFLNLLLAEIDYNMPQIAIGDNLLVKPWIEDFVRLNGSFIVRRGINMRELIAQSQRLSAYIRHTITQTKDSIWIAQREGRAKDADDRTQSSVLKMLAMSGEDGGIKSLLDLNIVPLSLSYEYDPCDYLKAREMLSKQRDPLYKKPVGEDLLNMQTGIFGYKGRVHFAIGTPLRELAESIPADAPHARQFTEAGKLIDAEIHRRYRLYPGNYVAWDLLDGCDHAGSHYSEEEKETFVNYLSAQIAKVEMQDKDEEELKRLILIMYANPARAYYAAQDPTNV